VTLQTPTSCSFGGRSSTDELLTNFCYIFTIIGVVTFTICFSLQEKYKEEVIKNTVKASTTRRSPLTAEPSMTAEAEKHMDGEIDEIFFNFVNVRYGTSYYC
jgi:hypothetical protein